LPLFDLPNPDVDPGVRPAAPGARAELQEPVVDYETLFLSSLPVIDDITRQVCRRHRLSGAEADDFRSEVRLHFLQHGCKVLRSFEGRSSLPTYVNVVVQRLYLDYRNRQWGRWRPSVEARRHGAAAVLFERLVIRDGWTRREAMELLRVNHHVDPREIDAFVRVAPRRLPRVAVSDCEAGDLESRDAMPDAGLVRAEQRRLMARVKAAIARARAALSPQEALILKMRFDDMMSVAAISRTLRLDQKRLYRTLDRILGRLRAALQAEGISRAA
jgi:RNA polymerase sigma factor (sigma-70 family)